MEKKSLFFKVLIVGTFMSFFACSGGHQTIDDPSSSDNNDVDVYVVGEVTKDDAPTHTIATLWKNGEAMSLPYTDKDTYAYSVYVSGQDVYVA